MFDRKEFDNLRKELENSEATRESVIQISREIISLSKRIIYAVQRDDFSIASNLIVKIKSKIKELKKIHIALDTNIGSVAFQEYVEAICFYELTKAGRMPSYKILDVAAEDYLMGVSDLTGELVRKAIFNVINKKTNEAVKIRDLVNDIYGEFLKFNLRNGELRKKADSIKWNLAKLEDVMYDIAVKGK